MPSPVSRFGLRALPCLRALPRVRALPWLCALLLAALTPAARAQTTPARELEAVRSLFNAGSYAEAVARARQAMAVVNFVEADRVELLKMAGLSAFALGDGPGAEQLFYQLLLLNPDYVLDPFAAPPPAIRAFEEVRKKNADALNLARQQIALRDERLKREAEERDRQKALAEEQRRRLDALSRTQRTVTEKPFVVNFLPFGAGQFQQERIGLGVLFATSEGLLAAASVVGFIAIETLFEKKTLTFDNILGTPDGKYTVTVRVIPAERQVERDVWGAVKLSTAIGFYAVWAIGIFDAVIRHQPQIVTEQPIALPSDKGAPDDAATGRRPRADLAPRLSPLLFPTPGGLGGGFTLEF